MAEFYLSFDIDNAAFDPDPSEEIARILQVIKDYVEAGNVRGPIYDVNGNPVGYWAYETT